MKNINLKNLKVAIAAEELTQLGGAERVLDALLEIFPKATIFTLVWDKVKTKHQYDHFDVRSSFIQKMPFGVKYYKWYLPLMPLAVESFDLKEFDLIISSSSALIKGLKTNSNQLHICYCHTPTRYLWTDSKSYLKTAPIPLFVRPFMPLVLWFLRHWDLKAAKRPNYFLANSENIQKRIKKYYQRDSLVIYPPIDWQNYKLSKHVKDYYLVVSRLEPYKKVDLVIKVFNDLGVPLKIVGGGTKKDEIAQESKANIQFLGRIADEELSKIYSQARALIFPQEEDLGLVAVESMASGRPVIAFKAGGALETVVSQKTGEFFYPQTVEALKKTVQNFDVEKYNPSEIRQFARKFDKTLFKDKIIEYIESKLME